MNLLPGSTLPDVHESELYRTIVARYSTAVLRSMCQGLDISVRNRSSERLAAEVENHLANSGFRAALTDLPQDWRPALSVLPNIPTSGWRLDLVRYLIRLLGNGQPDRVIRLLLRRGVLAVHHRSWPVRALEDFEQILEQSDGDQATVVPHLGVRSYRAPAIAAPVRGITRRVRRVRQSDGWELLVRTAVLWQRIAEAPLRLTQHDTPYKRDWERLDTDPLLSAALFDELVPIHDGPGIALVVARHLGLVVFDAAGRGRLRACLPNLWQEELPVIQRELCTALLGTGTWDESAALVSAGTGTGLLPAKRWGVLMLLSGMEPDQWIASSALALELAQRDQQWPGWRASGPTLDVPMGRWAPSGELPSNCDQTGWLDSFLLGVMYPAGVVQVAEARSSGKRVLRLSALGRWIVRTGEKPEPPKNQFEKTLFVQPNHEVVLYRQGLTAELLGQLASFCRWKGLGPALTLELTAESVYHGLELGRTGEEMIGILERHSGRPVPPAVKDSLRTWARRRQRLRLYHRSTVLEFSSPSDMQQAIARGIDGVVLSQRMLLLSDERSIPFEEFRLSGSRDYTKRSSLSVRVHEDGTLLELELSSSDLLVQCELPRFTEWAGANRHGDRLQYRVTPESLARADQSGLDESFLRNWFRQRTRGELPPSVELMLQASSGNPLVVSPLVVIETPSEQVADGLLQHPDTRPYIASRLGPTSLSLVPEAFDALEQALRRLGVKLQGGTGCAPSSTRNPVSS